jgi:hypothetical protein
MQISPIADSLKLAVASLVVTLIAVTLSLSGAAKFLGFVLLITLAPVTSLAALGYAIKELIVCRVLWRQTILALVISAVPFALIYQMRH